LQHSASSQSDDRNGLANTLHFESCFILLSQILMRGSMVQPPSGGGDHYNSWLRKCDGVPKQA
jgi:hypothetical protein